MKMNRRQFIAGTLGVFCCQSVFGVPQGQSSDWKDTCKYWMNLLMPADDTGPGADTPEVWRQLNGLMGANTEKGAHMRRLLEVLADADAKGSEMTPASALYSELHQLQLIFCELYYSSVVGAGDIGLGMPPQPAGYLFEL